MTDERPQSDPDGTRPGVLTPAELSSEEVRRLDETTHVVPLDETSAAEHADADGSADDQTAADLPGLGETGFAATGRIRTPNGRSTIEAGSDDIDEFFDDIILQLLGALAPHRDPEAALAVLAHASSLSVTVHADDG